MLRTFACLCLLLTSPAAKADDRPTVLLVIGAEGEPEFGREFTKSADRWADAAKRASARLVQIGREGTSSEADPTNTDKHRLLSRLKEELNQTTQPLWLVLIGHGTYDRREAKFNLRGPDVSDVELAEWIRPMKRPIAIINCASASAPFVNKLSAQGRVVVTATQSGHEIQFARFGEHMSAAIADPTADLDKDGQTSLLEAFIAASHRVEEFYKREGRLATEHALLDDNGDGLATPANWFQGIRATKAAKDGAPLDGTRAHQWHLLRSTEDQAMTPDQRARRDDLELKIASLREKKASLPEADYYAQLEDLLLQLARVYQQPPQPASPQPASPQPPTPRR